MKFSCMYKRIMLMIIFVFLSFAVYGIINVIQRQDKAITTNAIPITNKIVVVDAGHGKPDERSCLLTLKITLIFYKK